MATFRSTLAQNSLLSFALSASLLQRRYSKLPLRAIVAGIILWFAASAYASTVTVTTLADSGTGSLRASLAAANSGDTIVFSNGLTGTITLASTLTINNNVTIQGPGANLLTVSGNNAVTVFTVNSGAQASLFGLTIANGNTSGSGGGISNSGMLTVVNSVFNDNSSAGNSGGAINNSGTLVVSASSFIGNSSSVGVAGLGGAISNSGTLTVGNSTFSANSSSNGGAIFNEGTATISNSTFSANSTGSAGGGAIFNFSGVVTATNSIFVGNSAPVGASVANIATANLSNNVFFNNHDAAGIEDGCAQCTSNTQAVNADPLLAPLSNYGGPTPTMLPLPGSAAICEGSFSLAPVGLTMDQRGFPLNAENCSNGGVDAGAVQTNYVMVNTLADANDGNCTSTVCSLRDAITLGNSKGTVDIGFSSSVTGTILLGSSLPNLSGQINVIGPGATNLTVSGGGSATVGTVLSVSSGAQVFLSGLTVANGNANSGGGILNQGTLTVTNSAFAGNSTLGNLGGAIDNSGTLTVADSTFSANSCGNTGGAGGAIANSGTLAVANSTFSGNSSGNDGGVGGALYDTGTLTVSNSTFVGNFSANGGAVAVFGGTATITNNIFAHNISQGNGAAIFTPSFVVDAHNNLFFANIDSGTGSESDCFNCTINSQPIATDPMLAALGNYGGPTQTMLPLPGSAAICAASRSLAVDGNGSPLTTDQRGFPLGASSYCPADSVDAGAVQTMYTSVQFTNVPGSGSYNGVVGIAIAPAPVVSLTENNQSIGGVPITLLFSGASNTVTGLGPATTASGMGASFNNLIITTAGDNTLSVNLPITGAGANIQPAPLTASAAIDIVEQAQTITFGPLPNQPFGTAAFNVSATASSGLPVAFASTTPTVCTVSGSTVNLVSAGTCTLQATQAGNSMFAAATPVSASFTVTMVAATISFTVPNQSYGAAAFSVSASSNSTGVFTFTVTSGPAIVSGSTLTLTGVGTVTLQASEAADVNYTAGTKTASFTVAATGLQVTANSATRLYGAANPVFTGTVLGAKSSDMFSESFTTTATPTSPVGSYVIVPTASGANVGDYTVTTVDGALTVTQAPTTTGIIASSPSVNANQSDTLTTTVLSTTSGTPTGSVTFFDNGTALQTVTLSGGVASTNPTLSPDTTHVLTASYFGDTNFVASSTSTTGVTVAVRALQFTFAGTGANAVTVAPGSVAAYTFSISPESVNYAGPVTFSVGGLPPGATASFTPSTIPASGGAQTVTMTIQTPAATAHNRTPTSPLGGGKVPAMLSLLLLPLVVNNKLRRRLGTQLLMLVLFMGALVGLAAITGCGSGVGFSQEEPQTYTLTVTATSGSLQQTNTVRLTVQ